MNHPASISVLILCGAHGFLSGCAATIPDEALRLEESTLELRSIQTRTFAVASESVILRASVAALQDMEFNIDEIQKSLGVISASKEMDADSMSHEVSAIIMDLFCGFGGGGGCGAYSNTVDKHAIAMTMVVLPSLARKNEFVTRITLQRTIVSKAGQPLRFETIDDPAIYQEIFDKVSKAVFLEGEPT